MKLRSRSVLTGLLAAALGATCVGGEGDPYPEDPWPEYQRTASRLGRTSTIGPRTPRIEWTIQVDFSGFTSSLSGSTVMDAAGRIFVPQHLGITCVDSLEREIEWTFQTLDNVVTAPSVWEGRVLFGSSDDNFYCVDAATGEEIWSHPALPHPNRGQVVDDNLRGGVVYYPSESDVLYARRVTDGSLVWEKPTSNAVVSPPSLDGAGRVIVAGNGESARAHNVADGETEWIGPLAQHGVGALPVEMGRVYTSHFHSPGPVRCVDTSDGAEVWSYTGVGTNQSGLAIGHDGTIFICESSQTRDLIAISSNGDELWRYNHNAQVKTTPIVDGCGTVYLSSFNSQTDVFGVIHAVNSDGTVLWTRDMPKNTVGSPMLAPDGTLYVICADHYLYAFKDSNGDLNNDGVVDAADLAILLGEWGLCLGGLPTPCPEDLNGDGVVNPIDLARLLGAWGPG